MKGKNPPASVTLLGVLDTALGFGLMAFSMFLSIKLMVNTLTSGVSGGEVFIFGFFGALLGFGIDSAKCIALIYSVFYGELKRVAFILVFIAALFVSLVASYSELGRESYVTSVNSAEYTSQAESIQRSQEDVARYRQEMADTRYWTRKDMYQAKIDSIGLVITAHKSEQKKLIQEGAGETSFFNKAIRSVFSWIGIGISFRGANLVFGLLIEIIGSIFLVHWALENMDRTLNWRRMLQELVSSSDSRTFIDQRVAAKQALVASMRQAQKNPVNIVDIDFEMENLDLRIAAKVAGLLQRGEHLPPTLQRKLSAIPDRELSDPEAEKLLAELSQIESETKKLPKNETETDSSFTETDLVSFEKPKLKIESENQLVSVSKAGFSVNDAQQADNFLEKIRSKALDVRKLRENERFLIAKSLKNKGFTNAAIGRELGITGQGVGQLLKRYPK